MNHAKIHALVWMQVLCIAACGGDREAQPSSQSQPVEQKTEPAPPSAPAPAPPTPPAPPAPPITPDADGVVHLTGNDLMRFSSNRIDAKVGQKLKVELKNVGTLPKAAMGHDFVLLKPGTDVPAFAAKAAAAKLTDYVPPDSPEILAHTKLLGPGESDTIELPALEAGSYPYVCSFPAHYVFMTGQLVLQ